ncbi:YhgE/Pip family protein [Leifsonia naganoensis]|uniref:Putative membrane protein n=1 Tax=Leifsonia naganoensis TaxID=150025 RepID=A0A853DP86_9MICO|nr:YhgE/Pip family protein [Leifsonia naganoensis]NYK08121.1 putative membrane protein [Leifsonia naganoensis]
MTSPSPLRRPGSLFSLERMRSDKRITWLTIVGIILVPLAIGGLLVWALWNPTDRLDSVKAAVVNLDQPVKIGDQTVPLGRQLSAGLLDSSKDNFSWVLTDEKDAASGVADGRYVAVVTIPKTFSKAATSPSGEAADATQATIDVRTSDKSKLVDPAISQAVTTTATTVLNKQLTSTYLENVYVGFNTLHDQIGQAATGADQLSSGLTQLASGTHQLNDAAGQLASGASSLSSGIGQLSSGASGLSSGLGTLSSNMTTFANALTSGASDAAALPAGTAQLAAGTAGVRDGIGQTATGLAELKANCDALHPGDPICAGIQQAIDGITQPGTAQKPGLLAAATQVASGAQTLSDQVAPLPGQLAQSASAAQQLAAGTQQSASGAAQLADGAAQSASGASQLSDGVSQLATGITPLATGADQSASGAASLASGLKTAVAQLPSYDSGERTNLASVASEPVTQKASGTAAFGSTSIPLFASVALWLGALASFLVLQAVSRRALLTSRAAGLIALDGFVPAAVLGAVQGVLVAAIMQPALHLDAGHWFGFAGVAVGVGIAFAAVNHGLVALLGGIGRFLSMLVVVITLASGIVSTAPAFFDGALPWLPTSPAITALQGVIASSSDLWRGLGGLLLWAAFGFGLVLIAIARKRVVRASQLLPAE